MTEVTMNINSLILGFGLFLRKSWLYASRCISQVWHVTFAPPKVHQSGLNQWSGGGLTGSTINQVGKQDWFQPGFFKDDFWSHRTVPWLYVFSFQEENEIMSVLNWNDHLIFQSVGLFTLSKCTQCMNSVLDFVKISFGYRRMFVSIL